MTKAMLLELLRECQSRCDPEGPHRDADDALLAFIGDEAVTRAYQALPRRFA